MCRVRGVIKNCLWQINDNLYTLQDGGKYQPVGNAMDGECGIMVKETLLQAFYHVSNAIYC